MATRSLAALVLALAATLGWAPAAGAARNGPIAWERLPGERAGDRRERQRRRGDPHPARPWRHGRVLAHGRPLRLPQRQARRPRSRRRGAPARQPRGDRGGAAGGRRAPGLPDQRLVARRGARSSTTTKTTSGARTSRRCASWRPSASLRAPAGSRSSPSAWAAAVRGRELLPRQPDDRVLGRAAAGRRWDRRALPLALQRARRHADPDRPQARRDRRRAPRPGRLPGRNEDRLLARPVPAAWPWRRGGPRVARSDQRRRLGPARAHARPSRHAAAVVARRADAHLPAPDPCSCATAGRAAPVTTSTRSS